MIGLLEDVTTAVPGDFQASDDAIVLLGHTNGHLGGSAYWAELLDCIGGPPPPVDLDTELALQRLLQAAAERRLLASAHDLSDGGLAVALAEACIGGPWATRSLGAEIDLAKHADLVSDEGWLFGEDGGRVLASCRLERVAELQRLGAEHGIPVHYLGQVGAPDGDLIVHREARTWRWPVSRLRSLYHEAIPRRMAAPTSAAED